ncbi:DUF1707 SHOCT-like domain-containing protein [Nocardioides euryhalodurans]|uniref:DUF1707 domain-containing protein n=1 Tax=Nocardioides euryhalodurans TaxID=2518370 RepID=A0A4P7GH20_9ACTN|nr:DUF1707 domain-containing protein [Nocardioides euryhalodurans]QBR91021.1 DUF1707 domain-containing protein [Nocardioides euryhalodurans]
MTDPDQVWSAFSGDPRDPALAGMRASDADREVVHQVLTEAYADGRLDREELESRTTETQAARTLGDLLPPLEGLVAARRSATLVPEARIAERALESWRKDRREALWGLLSVSAIVWTIWLAGSFGGDGFDPYFPWPLFVTMAAALNLGRIQFQRDQIVSDEKRRLEKKRRKEIEKRREEDS